MSSETLNKLFFFGLIVLASGIEIIADYFLKRWSIENRSLLLIGGNALYLLGTFCWAISLKYELLSKAISAFMILNVVFVVLMGVFLFNETLSLTNKIGIVLGLTGLILIEV